MESSSYHVLLASRERCLIPSRSSTVSCNAAADAQNLQLSGSRKRPATVHAVASRAGDITVERRERYSVSMRYPRDYRSDPQAIASEVLLRLADGGTVPLG
jgi:hypothetical protein